MSALGGAVLPYAPPAARHLGATYRIGPARVAVEVDDPGLQRLAADVHAGRETDEPAELRLRLTRDESLPAGPKRPEAVRAPDGLETLAYSGWRARLDTVRGVADARIAATSDPWRGRRRVEALVRTVVGRWMLGRGGQAFHAAAMSFAGRGVLFAGPRGAGKTTLVRRAPGDRVLGDDHAIVVREGDGFRVFGTPYAGREGTASVAGDAPLRAVLLLAQAPRGTWVEPLRPADAFRALIPQLIHVGPPHEGHAIFEWLEALCRTVPVARLHWTLGEPVAPFVDGMGGTA